MKKYIFSFIAVLALAVQAADFRIIPTPKKQVFGKEITLAGTLFSIENKFPGFSPEEMVSDHLREYGFERADGKAQINIRFVQSTTDKWLKKYKESYRLEINSNGVTVAAAYIEGAWRGAGNRVLAKVKWPSQVMMMADTAYLDTDTDPRPYAVTWDSTSRIFLYREALVLVNRIRHNLRPNIVFADGHVGYLTNGAYYGNAYTGQMPWKIFWYYENTKRL